MTFRGGLRDGVVVFQMDGVGTSTLGDLVAIPRTESPVRGGAPSTVRSSTCRSKFLTGATGLAQGWSMIDGSRFPEDSVGAAAVSNFNRGNWMCYFTSTGRGVSEVWAMLKAQANGAFGELSPWGPAFAAHGDEDGALMFFDGPDGGLIAHTGFTDAGAAIMNEVLQAGLGPGRVAGLMVTPLIQGEVESSFEGSPAKEIVERSWVVPYQDHVV